MRTLTLVMKKSDLKKKNSTAGGYLTHDNGARPFRVKISGSSANIEKSLDDEEYTFFKNISGIKKKFIGKDPSGYLGNSILLDMGGGTYIFIGDRIYSFKVPAGDTIVKYESPVGNSDVPYPVAIGSKNLYFMLDANYVPKNLIPKGSIGAEDLYDIYYERNLKKQAKKMPGFKLIHNRI